MTAYQRGHFDKVQEQLRTAFGQYGREEFSVDDGPTGGAGIGSVRILVKPLRFSAVICALGGLFMMAGCLFMSLLTRPPAFTFALAAVWLVLVFYCLEALRTRLLGIGTRSKEFLIAASVMIWVVATLLYYLLR